MHPAPPAGPAPCRYYDRLYDIHVSSGYGTGAGSGSARQATLLDAQQPPALAGIDPVGLARCVLARVAAFELEEEKAFERQELEQQDDSAAGSRVL